MVLVIHGQVSLYQASPHFPIPFKDTESSEFADIGCPASMMISIKSVNHLSRPEIIDPSDICKHTEEMISGSIAHSPVFTCKR